MDPRPSPGSISSSSYPEPAPLLEQQSTSVTLAKPYYSKRPHKKSRAGCRNCKTRKVKCDEAQPICRNCRLRKDDCVYPNPPAPAPARASTSSSSTLPTSTAPASTISDSFSISPSVSGTSTNNDSALSFPPFSSTSSSSSSSHSINKDTQGIFISLYPDEPEPAAIAPQSPVLYQTSSYTEPPSPLPLQAQPLFRPTNIDEFDMKLLWYYTTATASSFTTDSTQPDSPSNCALRVRMLQIAFQTPFLMDSLLALTCMHMQTLGQDCDMSRALIYRVRSYEGYRRAIEEARPETFPALIANSLILTALSSQNFRGDEGKDLYIIDWLIVWRGIGLVIDLMGLERLFDSGLYVLFNRPVMDLEKAAVAIPSNLLAMVSTITVDDPDYVDVKVYFETLRYLGSLYATLRDGLDSVMILRIITWFTFLPRRFVYLVRMCRPCALVIIAYYSVFLKLIHYSWWMTGVGQRSLRDLCRYLGPEWQHLLIVPQMAQLVHSDLEIMRVLFEDPAWVPPPKFDVTPNPSVQLTMVDQVGRQMAWSKPEQKVILLDHTRTKSP